MADSWLAMAPIHEFGSDEQRERFLPPMARGERIGCFGLTEPDAGSDPGRMRSRARRVDGGYRLTGDCIHDKSGRFSQKCWRR